MSDNSPPDSLDIKCSQTDCISQAIRQNDKNSFLRYLRKRKENSYPLSADNQGWTALHVAASMPQCKDYLELLFKFRDDKLLDINRETSLGETALYIACRNGCEENVEILLQNGCDPCTFTQEDDTPLLMAIRKGNLKIIESLLNYPKFVNYTKKLGFGPLHLSVLCGHLEITRILLEKGADIRSEKFDNSIALHVATQKNYFDIARLLVKRDPTTINWQNIDGITPLMVAVQNCDLEFVNFLLQNGASADIGDKKGRMALHCAANRGGVQLLQLILEHTDVNSIDRCIDQCLSRGPHLLFEDRRAVPSLTCLAIASKSVNCLQVLLSSKLPKRILVAPLVHQSSTSKSVFSPLAYLFHTITGDDELLKSLLHVLLKHKITILDEFLKFFQMKWYKGRPILINPFSHIIKKPISDQEYFFSLLSANGVNLDYNLQCYHDTSQLFDDFTNYLNYYEPVSYVLSSKLELPADKKLVILKLLMSNSVILEPDTVCVEFNPTCKLGMSRDVMMANMEECLELFQYLISLKPVYFTQFQLCCRTDMILPRFPFARIEEEFSKSTLQQLCRTVIRRHLRDYSLEDNLRNFKRKIMELPLPTLLKDYLLFKV